MTSRVHTPLALAVVMLAGGGAQPVWAADTVDFLDADGDALFHAPACQDLLLGQLTNHDGGLQLLMEVAGAVPESPDLPHPANEVWWTWVFDFDETAAPRGYPWELAHRPEFVVYVRWDGSDFAGFAIDRRPLLTGGEAVVAPVAFAIDQTIIRVDLDSDLVGDFPDSFGWQLAAFDWSHVGSEGYHIVDNFDFNYVPFP